MSDLVDLKLSFLIFQNEAIKMAENEELIVKPVNSFRKHQDNKVSRFVNY